MTFPLDLVIIILIAELYRSADPAGAGMGKIYLGPWGMWALHLLLAAAAAAMLARWVEFKAHQEGPDRAYRYYRALKLLYRGFFVAWYGAFLYLDGWWETLSLEWRLPSWSVADDLLLLLPYLSALALWHLASFRLGKVLWGRRWSRWEHIKFYQRQEVLPVLAPWLILRAATDAAEAYSPHLPGGMEEWVVSAVTAAGFALVLALFPEWIRLVLDCRRLPEGSLRMHLDDLAERAGVKIKDFLVWRTGGARIISAVLVGFFGWTRYCILSDTLLEALDPREVEAVVAHEIGHIRGHHIGMYFLMVLMFSGGVLGLFGLLPTDVASNYFIATPVLVLAAVAFWRGFFARLSRAAEDEADFEGAALMKSPVPLVNALRKVSELAGGDSGTRSWRHRPVEQRIRNLEKLSEEPERIEALRRKMRLLRLVLTAVSLLIGSGGFALAYPRLWSPQSSSERLLKAAEREPENPDAWLALGRQYLKEKQFEKAFGALLSALEADPGMQEVRNALDALPLPSPVISAAKARVYLRTCRYRDAYSELQTSIARGDDGPVLALMGYLKALPGPNTLPNPFFAPQEARQIAQQLDRNTLASFEGYLLRLQLASLQSDTRPLRNLLRNIPSAFRQEPEIRSFYNQNIPNPAPSSHK